RLLRGDADDTSLEEAGDVLTIAEAHPEHLAAAPVSSSGVFRDTSYSAWLATFEVSPYRAPLRTPAAPAADATPVADQMSGEPQVLEQEWVPSVMPPAPVEEPVDDLSAVAGAEVIDGVGRDASEVDGEDGDDQATTADRLLEILMDLHGASPLNADLAQRAGCSMKALFAALNTLEADGAIRREGMRRGRKIYVTALDEDRIDVTEEPAAAPSRGALERTQSAPRTQAVPQGPVRPRPAVRQDDDEVAQFIAANGVRRFEPGEFESVLAQTFRDAGAVFEIKRGAKVSAPVTVDGSSMSIAKAVERANEIRKRKGLSLLAAPKNWGRGSAW
ncbi:MAG: hypothetical protein NXI07_14310, partial [bacterium]|nr:hypothetical protein [bacterium]